MHIGDSEIGNSCLYWVDEKKELPLVFLYLLLWDLFKFYFPLEAIIVSIRALFSCSYAVSSKTQQPENQNALLQNRPLENYLLFGE